MTRASRLAWRRRPLEASARCRNWPLNLASTDDDPPLEAAYIFERSVKKTVEVDADAVRTLNAKILELAVANNFFVTISTEN